MIIDANGNISFPNMETGDVPDKKVEGSGNSYTVTYSKGPGTDMVYEVTFKDSNNATYKINNGSAINLIKRQ